MLNNVNSIPIMLNIKYIEEYLKTQKITKVDFARRLGISRPALDRILDGCDIRLHTLERLSETMGVPFFSLIDKETMRQINTTNGANSPIMSGQSTYINGETLAELERLREENRRLQTELLNIYRKMAAESCPGIVEPEA